jgi:hypothetical protein
MTVLAMSLILEAALVVYETAASPEKGTADSACFLMELSKWAEAPNRFLLLKCSILGGRIAFKYL